MDAVLNFTANIPENLTTILNTPTIDQKIQLMTLASKIGLDMGAYSIDIDKTISNYNKMVEAITATGEKKTS